MNDPRGFGATSTTGAELESRVVDGRYRIDALLARGGMGSVFRATRLDDGLPCALKIVTKDDRAGEEGDFVARFVREAATTARLEHPNCVTVLDFGETDDGLVYLAMELLEGSTLAAVIREEGPLEIARFLRLAKEICAGVRAAHRLEVVHRDLKTANIFLARTDDGGERVKLVDFGIAKGLRDDGMVLTLPGQMLGTPTYMAPEQILERPVDTRADIYSLGVVFFEMLVGRVPFDGTNYLDVLAGHAREPVPLMSAVRPDVAVPEALEALVRHMLAKDADARVATLDEVLDRLDGDDMTSTLGSLLRSSPASYSGESPRRDVLPTEEERMVQTRISRVPGADMAKILGLGDPTPRRRRGADDRVVVLVAALGVLAALVAIALVVFGCGGRPSCGPELAEVTGRASTTVDTPSADTLACFPVR